MATATSFCHLGATVRGPEHQRKNVSNQDAWMVHHHAGGSVAVVADGLGSAPLGREGARAACRAGREAARIAEGAGVAPTLHTIAVLRAVWHQLTAPLGIKQCATTCLFATVNSKGGIFAAQVGDGLIAHRRADGDLSILEPKEKAFQNRTETIASTGAQQWQVMSDPLFAVGDALLMATDGVADDLEMSRLSGFVAHLLSEYLPMPPVKRSASLRCALRLWPTKHHRDDKTLVVLTRTA